ncbi:MAG: UDP-glucose/GDP-mannose dehydrogenase family protein [Planctomycetia bacterium]|nr:UDP-glucose/GDP-mannose dehydrogenase family protein [Planctomycetia bacterium]
MRLAVVGTGYVGLVSGTCFAESGNQVIGIDNNPKKIEILESGKLPIYEPGLLEMVQRNRKEGRLTFTTDLQQAIQDVEVVYLCVGTPQGDDGSADLSAMWAVGDAIADKLQSFKLLVIKSTVPVGTNRKLTERIAARTKAPFEVASNPEFLKEGAAIDDFMKPDRVVVGVRSEKAQKLLHELYAPFLRTERPFLVMPPESAEMTKYVANAMLATKISFINEMAGLCDKMGADINDVRRGIGHDVRIGFQFLHPGPGYGGSCFPKDVNALIAMAREKNVPSKLIEAVDLVNDQQKRVLPTKIKNHFKDKLAGKTLAVWGLAFKPRTDDIRESPSLTLIDEMLAAGVKLRVHDPEAISNVREEYGDKLTYCERRYDALEGADALVLVTEWQEFRTPDFLLIKELLKTPVIFDGRNIYDPAALKQQGFTYYGIGRR